MLADQVLRCSLVRSARSLAQMGAVRTVTSLAKVNQRDGFVMADWRHDGFEMRAVADLAPAEMKAFVSAADQAIDGDH